MAHRRIKVSTTPYVTREGKVSPKKRKHTVTCRSHGKLCYRYVAESRTEADERAEAHRELHRQTHAYYHPNDAEAKQRATPKQIPSRPTFATVADNHTALHAYQKVSHTHE